MGTARKGVLGAVFALVLVWAAAAGGAAASTPLVAYSSPGGFGVSSSERPAATPWVLPAGDYCSSYKFDVVPGVTSPFLVADPTNLAAFTGFDPGGLRWLSQVRHLGAGSSACQTGGTRWGMWLRADDLPNRCTTWCGVRHDHNFGLQSAPVAFGPTGLRLDVTRHLQTYSLPGGAGWGYFCAMLADPSGNRLEYCFRLWATWDAEDHDPVDAAHVFYDSAIPATFANISTNVPSLYATNLGGSSGTSVTRGGPAPADRTYSVGITRAQLIDAAGAINAEVLRQTGSCTGLPGAVTCYSTDPGAYRLVGYEDGYEFASAAGWIGGYVDGEHVAPY